MIKKIAACFLVMAIVAGCAQAPVKSEKPVDSPVVEQPQKPVEQEKPKEETQLVKKIDDSKEYIYIKETRDEANDEIFKDLAKDYVYEGFDKNDFFQWMAISYMPDPITELLVLNIDSTDAKSLNDYFTDLYENKVSLFCEWKWLVNGDILTIVRKAGSFIPFSDGFYFFEVFHFNMNSGKIVSNPQLLELYNVDESDIQEKIDIFGEENEFYKDPGYTAESPDGAKGAMLFNEQRKNRNTIGYQYSDKSFLMIEQDELYFILGVSVYSFHGRILYYKIKIS